MTAVGNVASCPLPRVLVAFATLLAFGIGPPADGHMLADGLATGDGALAAPEHREPPSTSYPRLASSGRARTVIAIEELRRQLSTANSATVVLDRWCARHGMSPAGAVVADKIADVGVPDSAMVRRLLRVRSSEQIGFRHVRLRCRDHVLSEAMLWYVPGRLPAEINRQLSETEIPFGRAVAPLRFRRHALAAGRMGRSERSDAANENMPTGLFDQRALLVLPGGAPIAYVREVYLPGVLDFSPMAR